MKIGSKEINVNKKPVLISEISGNHGGSLSNAIKLIKLAAKNGTDLIKLQTYEADNLTLNCATNDFLILDNNSLWKNKRLYELYKKGETKKEWHQKLFAISRKCNVECFSSIFSEKDIPFLENLKIPAYKVASFENNHYPLIEKLIETKKPILVSTGLNSFSENLELINFFRKKNYKNFALLKCTSSYPADFKNLNLQTITDMRKKFQCEIGFSDHSIGKLAAYGSIFCGASFVEKHIRLKKNLGIDAKFSLDVSEIKSLKKIMNDAFICRGKINYDISKSEKPNIKFKRSIYVSKNLKKGDIISNANVKIVRPSYGLEPKYFSKILGKKIKRNISFGKPFKWSLIKD